MATQKNEGTHLHKPDQSKRVKDAKQQSRHKNGHFLPSYMEMAQQKKMNGKVILLTGATGFVGHTILEALVREGYQVRALTRNPQKWEGLFPMVQWVQGDFSKDLNPGIWEKRLAGIDIIINAVGIIQETNTQRFSQIHSEAPIALFQAARQAGIDQILQISALGADNSAKTPYHLTKRRADQFLRDNIKRSVILRPSLIVGEGGESCELFTFLASLPLLPLPENGVYMIQPLLVSDLVENILKILEKWPHSTTTLDVAGPMPITLKRFLASIRSSLHLKKALTLPIPAPVVSALARFKIGMLNPDTLTMLRQGSTADPTPMEALTGVKMRSVSEYWRGKSSPLSKTASKVAAPLIRLSTAFIWIYTGLISIWIYPVSSSLQLLAESGVPDSFQTGALYGSSVLDILLGVALFSRLRSLSYLLQILLILFYTTVLTSTQAHFWIHPFGPVSKNIPLIALAAMGWLMDQSKKDPDIE